MRKNWNLPKKALITLGVLVPLIGAHAVEDAPHAPALPVTPSSAKPYQAPSNVQAPNRDKQSNSPYDLFIGKLEEWLKSSKDNLPLTEVNGDDLRVRLSHDQIQSAIKSIKHLKKYRDAVERQCKGIDESTELLINTLDHCLAKNVLFPAVQKSKLVQDSFELNLSAKALGACHQELDTFFTEKEKKTSLTKEERFKEDALTKSELSSLFEAFGSEKATKDSSAIASSELIKTVKKVDLKNLCDANLDEKALKQDSTKDDKKQKEDASSKEKATGPQLPKAEFKERIEETIEQEEQLIPIAPKKLAEPTPVAQPVPQPTYQPQPVPATPKPTYQPQPYQAQPYQQPKKQPAFEPVPPRAKNNTPFIPAAAPAPRAAVVGGGGAIAGPVPLFRGGLGGLGLSFGFGSYSSNYGPMPYPPMPLYSGGVMPMGMSSGPMISGISSAPRTCLVCSTVTPTPLPTLGLGTMLAQPCPRVLNGQQPMGACRANWNQPIYGIGGINPYYNQIPRYPGQPVNPGVTPGPQPQVIGGQVIPNRTTVPRVNPTSIRRVVKRGLR